jgi:uncharacterized membrane protein
MIRQFWRIMRLMSVLSIVVAVIAVLLVVRGEEGLRIHMIIATALGVALTVLLGTALMTLAFLSSRSGHDDQVRRADKDQE